MPQSRPIKAEVVIIGAGSAGMSAYKSARNFTDSILVIEEAHYGTTCARVGCMPSKLLIAAAEAAHTITHAARFGVHGGPDMDQGFMRIHDNRGRLGFGLRQRLILLRHAFARAAHCGDRSVRDVRLRLATRRDGDARLSLGRYRGR